MVKVLSVFSVFVKSKGQEATGVAPLKNKEGYLQSHIEARANILNEQFVSAVKTPLTSQTWVRVKHHVKH